MTDIVQKLRTYRPRYGWPEEYSTVVEPTMNHVAADEIERLREALRFYACQCKDDMSCETFGEYGRRECGHTARVALGEDK